MRSIKALIISGAFVAAIFIGSPTTSVNAQETMMKQAANKVVSGTKKGYKTGRRVGTTIGKKTWTGTKWVATNSWSGGKWIAVKTVKGTKWVYRKGKGVVTGTKKRVM
jgi:hypothetical protein